MKDSHATLFMRWSFLLIVLTSISVGGLWFVVSQNAAELSRRQHLLDSSAGQLAKQTRFLEERALLGDDTLTQLQQSIPHSAELGNFFTWLEQLTARHGATVKYNFTGEIGTTELAPGEIRIPVDFFGTVPNLAALLTSLETGLYHMSVQSMRFETTPEDQGELHLEVMLYGQTSN